MSFILLVVGVLLIFLRTVDCKCPTNCLTCTSEDTCSACSPGYYGQTCQSTCSVGCQSNECEKGDGSCTCTERFTAHDCTSCKDGYYDTDCSNICPKNCVNCTGEYNCTECKSGYFGTTCSNKCPENCLSCTGYNRCTQCKDGLTGPTCSQLCFPMCNTCVINAGSTCTSCARGRYATSTHSSNDIVFFNCFYACSKYCVNGFCENGSGKCIEGCVHGYTGDRCDCPELCTDSYCLKVGYCNTATCEGGYIESTCSCIRGSCADFPCNTTCRINTLYASGDLCCKCPTTCRDNLCSDADTCLNGCVDGFHGDGCQNSCQDIDSWCLICTDNKCIGCLSGYFASVGRCTKCPRNCLNGTCNTPNGTCLEGCENRFWGNVCNITCGENCKTCDRSDGHCTVCDNDKYKRDCSHACSVGCMRDGNSVTCDIDDGSCANGCRNNTLHGEDCQLDCNTTCVGHECDRVTGKCTKGCEKEYHGEWCEHRCSKNCIDNPDGNSCTSFNGTCQVGCKNGFYKRDCRARCAAVCINETCKRDTGYCTHGCIEGFTGIACGQASEEQSEPESTDVVVGAVIGTVVFLLLIAAIAVVVFYIRRRKGRGPRSSTATPLTTSPGTNVEMAERGIGETDIIVGVTREDTSMLGDIGGNISSQGIRVVAGNESDPDNSTYDQPDQNIPQPNAPTYEPMNIDTSKRISDHTDAGDSEYEQPNQNIAPPSVPTYQSTEPTQSTYEQLDRNQPEMTYGQLQLGDSTYENHGQNTTQASQSTYEQLDRERLGRDTSEQTYEELDVDTDSRDYYNVSEAIRAPKK